MLEKIVSPLHLPLKLDAIFKTQLASKVPIHLQDKLRRTPDIPKQYETILPVNKKQQPKGKPILNPVTVLAGRESLQIVLYARY